MPLTSDEQTVQDAKEIINLFHKLFGNNPGIRPAHGKGILLSGTFTPTPEASKLSKAPQFQNASTSLTLRFSNSTGLPHIPDNSPSATPHGLALRFHLPSSPDGKRQHTDIIAHSTPHFPVRTGGEFISFVKAIMASPPSEGERHEGHTPLEMFLEQHPAAARFVREAKPAPSSHARERYFGLSAYRLIDKEGKTTNVRFQILPAEGVEHLDAVRVMESGEDYLQEEMKARIEKGPATFGLVAQIAEEGDRTDDITEEWPESRKIVKLGEVKVEKVVEENASEQQKIIFDPIPRVDGVEPSDDPLLVFRAAVYLLSGRERRAAPGVESTKSK